jgi:hypothetical protein
MEERYRREKDKFFKNKMPKGKISERRLFKAMHERDKKERLDNFKKSST